MPDEAQRHRSDSGASDTSDGQIVPIVFVPGVMGSRLKFKKGGLNWDPDDKLGFIALSLIDAEERARHLNSENEAEPDFNLSDGKLAVIKNDAFVKTVPARSGTPAADDKALKLFFEQRGWGSVVFDFYGQLFLSLERLLNEKKSGIPHPVYAVGYDWRDSNVTSGNKLRQSITSILQEHKPAAKKVIIVTHSMGGLVTLSALHDGFDNRVAGAVHCVMPSTGAAVAYRRFQTGAALSFDGPPEAASALDWIGAAFLNKVMGTTRERYALTQAGLKGPLQLLPSNKYPDLFLNMIDDGVVKNNQEIDDIYDIYLRDVPPGIVPKPVAKQKDSEEPGITPADIDRLKRNIRLARDFHRRLSLNPTALDETFVLIGDGVNTDVQFDWLKGAVMQRTDFDQKVIKAPFGDGTVPAVSAEFRFANPDPENRDFDINPRTLFVDSIFNGAQHAECFKDANLVAKVVASVTALVPPTTAP
jgi:pimeloyl-ACP methyl ester carboxylesterase